jgi:phosphinothricin acetyltransferase
MPTISIRPAIASDIPGITEIYGHAVRHGTASFEIEPPDEAEMGRRFATLVDGNYPYFAADLDGTLSGFAYAGPFHHRPAYRLTVEDSIYVAPAAIRTGVGRALLFRLIVESDLLGFRQMIGVIGDSANAASIELHRQAGFRVVGTFEAVGFKFGRWLDTVLMQRTLGEGGRTLP